MERALPLKVNLTDSSRLGTVALDHLPFGKVFTDHMLVAEFRDGAWAEAAIIPYGAFPASPAMSAIHYGQSIFEGIKAFRNAQGDVSIFRPTENLRRFRRSAARMEMPEVPEELFIGGMRELLRVDKGWMPTGADHSMYIRPFMFATDDYLGVRPSETYRFMVILSPSGPFFSQPQRIHVERQFVRAVPGGIGFAKAAGNYGASLHAAAQARKNGYDQVLWTDPFEHRYVQEIGMMNVFFRIGDTIVTPDLAAGTILHGVTRDSLLVLLRESGHRVEERPVTVDELHEAHGRGELKEAFGAGTAAVVAMIREIGDGDRHIVLDPEAFTVAKALYRELTGIQGGVLADRHGWLLPV